jgi:uncharacterized membrane protein
VPAGLRLAPLWFQLTSWLLALGGLGMSVYLTIAHYDTKVSLICPATSFINCEKVTSSPQSMVFGVIPVAVLGLAFYIFLAVVTAPWVWRAEASALRWARLPWLRLGSLIIGMLFVLYLIYTELFTLNTICLLCTTVHVITFALFGLIVFALAANYGSTNRLSRAEPRRIGQNGRDHGLKP